ncbi:hypothetical protein BGX23_009372 [Mortierella sp. AD031]|nr:hypothetical protein BGX23_009372 [Mortierella sp. AD031]
MKTAQLLIALISLTLLALTFVSAATEKSKEFISLQASSHQRKNRIRKQVLAGNKAASAAFAATHLHAERFSSCGDPTKGLVIINSIKSSPQLCSGCQACVKIDGELKEQVEQGATVRIQATKTFIFTITVMDETYDLCQNIGTLGGQRPIPPNANGTYACFPIPTSIPTGITANIKVTGQTVDKKPLFCIQGSAWLDKCAACPSAAL